MGKRKDRGCSIGRGSRETRNYRWRLDERAAQWAFAAAGRVGGRYLRARGQRTLRTRRGGRGVLGGGAVWPWSALLPKACPETCSCICLWGCGGGSIFRVIGAGGLIPIFVPVPAVTMWFGTGLPTKQRNCNGCSLTSAV